MNAIEADDLPRRLTARHRQVIDTLSRQATRGGPAGSETGGWLPISTIISRLTSPPSYAALSEYLLVLFGYGLVEQRQTGGRNWRYEYRIAQETQAKRGLPG